MATAAFRRCTQAGTDAGRRRNRGPGLIRTLTLLAAVALALRTPAARADHVYTDPAAWEAAVAGRAVRDVALPPTLLPRDGGTVRGAGITLTFPANHGDVFATRRGWGGDVHRLEEPLINLVVFDEPVYAFGAVVAVAADGDPDSSSILLRFNDTYRLTASQYVVEPPRFFGWVSDGYGVDRLEITSGSGRHFYFVADARFVSSSPGVPEPRTASLALIAVAGSLCLRKRRSRAFGRFPPRLPLPSDPA